VRIVESAGELSALAEAERVAGRRIALVPTMGALHAGHLSLVAEARRRADRVWVSIFVNPAQFDDPGDLARYPRSLEADLAACRAAGVDLVFAPPAREMYPAGAATWVGVDALCEPLCGRSRPGHFRGVTTVVAKLLAAARPHVAVFGQKDFQQLVLIRRMVRDLLLGVEIVAAPIVREADGLASSSRNATLDPEARRQAVALSRALDVAERALAGGETRTAALLERVRAEIGAASRAELDYAELRDPDSLEPAPDVLRGPALLALAVRFRTAEGGAAARVRLIDNRVLVPPAGHGADP
jgi:pantoate--beta-alanine ligase